MRELPPRIGESLAIVPLPKLSSRRQQQHPLRVFHPSSRPQCLKDQEPQHMMKHQVLYQKVRRTHIHLFLPKVFCQHAKDGANDLGLIIKMLGITFMLFLRYISTRRIGNKRSLM